MNQAVLLAVALGWNQNGFAVLVFDANQLHAQIANKVRAVEYVTDLIFQQFIHGIYVAAKVQKFTVESMNS